jgi:HSP20 family protein
MALARWSPWQGLFDIQRDMDQLMGRMFGSMRPFTTGRDDLGGGGWVPAVDVFARDKDLVVRAELPGINPDKDVDISLQDGVLTIRGERRQEHRDEGNGIYRTEFSYGSFERSVLLPEGVKEKDIQATYESGILEVVVAGAGELAAPRRIPIEVGGRRKVLSARGRKKT